MAKTEAFKIEGFAEAKKKLEAIMTEDPTFRHRLHAAMSKILKEVRNATASGIKGDIPADPRQAYRAVRHAVYKRILGGQVNILSKRKAGRPGNYRKPQKGLPARGGNRWGRSERTIALEGYTGTDRGFVLRFLNAGTDDRYIRSYTAKDGNRYSIKPRRKDGDRGRIAARNFFGPTSQKEMEQATVKLQDLIDSIINETFY